MKKIVIVNDLMQKGYSYELSEPMGKHFDPSFKPQLAPQEMLSLGVFGGVYMRDCASEFPKEWFVHGKFAPEGSYAHVASLNFFGVNASQPLSVWKNKGWIHADDPRGWFQWYCRYYMGRRHEDDMRQIKRWKAMVRHIAQIRHNCRAGDFTCHTRQRQALLHWAYDSRKL
ncbi:MAG: hypothetical protein WCG07_02770 [Candidatus Taylorbacteria bacterium]